jgi:TonB family protein
MPSGAYAANHPARDPITAATLSLVPGLGQFYNGQTAKGFLFLEAAALNFLLFSFMVLTEPIAKALRGISSEFHCVPNTDVLRTLNQMHLGSAASNVLLLLIVTFIIYAARDAYDAARIRKSYTNYPDSAIGFSEATSGSYIFHFTAMLTLAVLTLFFIAPPPVPRQITEIEFVPQVTATKQPKKAKSISTKANDQDAKAVPNRPVSAKQAAGAVRKADQVTKTAEKEAATKPQAPAKPTEPTKQASAPRPIMIRPTTPPAPPTPIKTPTPPIVHTPETPAPPMVRPVAVAKQIAMLPTPPMPHSVSNTNPQSHAPQPTLPAPHTTSQPAAPGPLPQPRIGQSVSSPIFPQAQPINTSRQSSGIPAPLPLSHGQGSSSNAPAQPGPSMPMAGRDAGQSNAPAPASARTTSTTGSSVGDVPQPTKAGSPGATGGKNLIAVAPRLGQGTGNQSTPAVGTGSTKDHGDGPKVKDVDFSKYMAELQRRIKSNWTPPRNPTSNRVRVIFNVALNGELSGLKIERSSGSATIDQAAIKAVEQAAPFPPLPEGSANSTVTDNGKVNIEFTFDYNVFGGGQGRFVNY